MKLGMMQLIRKLAIDPQGGLFSTPTLFWEAPTETRAEDWAPTENSASVARRNGGPTFLLLRKTPNKPNPMVMGITLGRVETNDIIIDDSSISRFHAWFQHEDRANRWYVRDADSKNGTFIDGLRVSGEDKGPLTDKCKVKFGDIEMTFMMPQTADAFVRESWAQAKSQNR